MSGYTADTHPDPVMDFTFHRPYRTELHPINSAPERPSVDLFELRMLYREGGNWQFREMVHVPWAVQAAFSRGEVLGFHLETLGMNSAASKSLPASPQFAVLGMELIDGSRLAVIPASLVRARRTRLVIAGVLASAGIAAAFTPTAWFGGLAVGVATQLIRTALSIRVKPFWPAARSDAAVQKRHL